MLIRGWRVPRRAPRGLGRLLGSAKLAHCAALSTLMVTALGCAGGPGDAPEVPLEQVEAARGLILGPFKQEREVLCDDLVLEVTANFLQDLTQPSHDPDLHRFEQDDREGVTEYRWVNPKGIDGLPFTFYVQQTKVVVVYSARLKVLTGRQPMTLDMTASGNAAVFHDDEDRMQDGLQRVEVRNGRWRTQ